MHIAHVNVCGTDMMAGGGACAGLQRGTSVPAPATTPASGPRVAAKERLAAAESAFHGSDPTRREVPCNAMQGLCHGRAGTHVGISNEGRQLSVIC